MLRSSERQKSALNFYFTMRRCAEAQQFLIKAAVSYQLLGVQEISKVGSGRTINISSETITFAPERGLPNRIGLEVAVEWPILCQGSLAMELILYGFVTSADPSATTLGIMRYEFRPKGVGS